MSDINYANLRELAEAANGGVDPSRWDEAWSAWAEFEDAATPEVVLALLDRLEAAIEYVDDAGNWSAYDNRRRLLLDILNGEDPR